MFRARPTRRVDAGSNYLLRVDYGTDVEIVHNLSVAAFRAFY